MEQDAAESAHAEPAPLEPDAGESELDALFDAPEAIALSGAIDSSLPSNADPITPYLAEIGRYHMPPR